MDMNRSVFLAGSLSLLQSTACGSDGLQGTVGEIDSCGTDAACDAGAPPPSCDAAGSCSSPDSASDSSPDSGTGYLLIAPTVQPLSETAAQVSWVAAPSSAGAVSWYEVRTSTSPSATPTVVASLSHLDPSVTSAVVSDLAPGTLGRVVVAAAIASPTASSIGPIDGGDAGEAGASGSVLWTPYGAINEATVSSVTPLSGYAFEPYAEGMFVSANFSMFFAHAYVDEASFVFNGYPSSSIAAPVYNFASPLIQRANGFTFPDVTDVSQIWSDGVSKVLIANDNENRVLVYNHLPLTPDTASPDLILGQETWTGMAANDGQSAINARGFHQAAGACFNGSTLYVRDNANHRILGWRTWPTQMGQPADFVLGQPDFVSSTPNGGGISKATLNLGIDGGANLDCTGGRLAATDTSNDRILIWLTAPTATGTPADRVLGQSTGTEQAQPGAGGIAAGGMLSPQTVVLLDGGGGRTAVVVSDSTANRVVEWDDIPTTDGAPFNRVYGQPDASTVTANTGGLSMGSLDLPLTISVDDQNRFWVADFNNGRALRFDLDSPVAIDLFGQRRGTSAEFFPGSFSATRQAWTHAIDSGLSLDPVTGLFATSIFKRAMFWDTAPTNGNTPVSAIQGQPDVTSSGAMPTSATSISGFCSAVGAGTRVYWSDTDRILSKVGTFTANDSVPDVILGNKDFDGNTVAPTTLDYAIAPTFLATDGTALLAVDGARIVGWRQAPQTSNVPIDIAVGQPTILVNTANNGGVMASSLGGGRNAMTISGGKLIVADPANNRVLVWNMIPSATGVAANVVLGQSDFVSSATGDGMANMNAPSSVAVLDGKLVVSDTGNSRLLVFDSIPETSGSPATQSWDPRTATFSLPSWFNVQELAPHDLGAYGGRLYVGQTSRILVLPDLF